MRLVPLRSTAVVEVSQGGGSGRARTLRVLLGYRLGDCSGSSASDPCCGMICICLANATKKLEGIASLQQRFSKMYKHLLIAIDGSELAEDALKQGVAFAKALSAKVTIATVTEPWHAFVAGDATVGFPIDEYETNIAQWALETLGSAAKVAANANVACETVHAKDKYPADGILETAEQQDCDLIVMASHGRHGLTRLLLGSQANHVVTRSTLPVLICR